MITRSMNSPPPIKTSEKNKREKTKGTKTDASRKSKFLKSKGLKVKNHKTSHKKRYDSGESVTILGNNNIKLQTTIPNKRHRHKKRSMATTYEQIKIILKKIIWSVAKKFSSKTDINNK